MRSEERRRGGAGQPVCLLVSGRGVDPLVGVVERLGWRAAVVDATDAVDVATVLRPDLVIVDAAAAHDELMRELISHPRLEWVPLAVVVEDRVPAARWLDEGARDVLRPSLPADEVRARLRSLMRVRTELVALARRNRELDELAGIDVLTDLPNRRRLDEQLRVLEGVATRRAEPLGIVLVDIDHFKVVNDTHGHQAGDEVLRQLADRLRNALRSTDAIGRRTDPTVGRWAGDEFIVGFAGTVGPEVELVAERLRRLIADEPFLTADGPIRVTISLGGAVAVGEPWPELFRRADVELYKVKQGVRNASRVAHPEVDRDPSNSPSA